MPFIPNTVIEIGRNCFSYCRSYGAPGLYIGDDYNEKLEQCWLHNADERPSFSDICSLLKHKAYMLFSETNFEVLSNFVTQLEKMNVY